MSRLSVNINDETSQALKDLASARNTSVTDVVRRAVAVYKLVEDETAAGKRLQMVDDRDRVKEIALI